MLLLCLLSILIVVMIHYNTLNNSDISDTVGFQISYLLLLAIIIYPLYTLAFYLLKFILFATHNYKEYFVVKQNIRNKRTMLSCIKTFKKWNPYGMHHKTSIPRDEFDGLLKLFIKKGLVKQEGYYEDFDCSVRSPVYIITNKGEKMYKKWVKRLQKSQTVLKYLNLLNVP
jgi:hypothetical protein